MGSDQAEHQAGKRPAHRRLHVWAALVTLCLLIAGGILVLGLTDRVIPAPAWLVARIEANANRALGGQGRATVGGVEIYVDDTFVPHVRLRDVELFASTGVRIARLPGVQSTLDGAALLGGRFQPRSLTISGAEVALSRKADGSLDFTLGEGDGAVAAHPPARSLDPVAALDAFDRVFTLPTLRDIETIEISDLSIRFDDELAGKLWRANGSWLRMNQTAESITINLAISATSGGAPMRAALSLISAKESPAATLSADVRDVASRDLASQSPALAWLSALDAPISGAIWSSVDDKGLIQPMNATLSIGKGALQPTETTKPVRFDSATLAMTYDPAQQSVTFRDIAVDGAALKLRASAKAWLKDINAFVPNTLVGQVAIRELQADPEGLFENPVVLSKGALDLKLTLSPFRVQVGQLVLMDGARRISAKGDFRAESKGWASALDVTVDAIESQRLLALWPVAMVPKTREWLRQNVATSEIFNVSAGLRVTPGAEPQFSLGYEFRTTEVTVIKTLPPVQDGAGYATITGNTYTLVVDDGYVRAPDGGRINVAGTVLRIPDLRVVPASAEVTLHTRSSITAALSLLDEPPFEFMKKAGQRIDIAEGQAILETQLKLSLTKKIRPEDVSYKVKGTLNGVHSDRIVPARNIAAEKLDVTADRDGLSISGSGTFDGIPADVRWRQDFGPQARGKSSVDGTVELSPRALKMMAVSLPDGAVAGTGRGRIKLDLVKGERTSFTLASDLAGLTLAIPEVGWTKPAGQKGNLSVTGTLGLPATIDGLEISGAGLSASGKVVLNKDGSLNAATFEKASLNDWFRGGIVLTGRGKGRNVSVEVTGGTADLRSASFGEARGGGDTPITVALDTLRISSGIALTGFRGAFGTGGGFSGRFAARVNGEAEVSGTVEPVDGRAAFRVTSDDAGRALRASGLYRQGNGGTLSLRLDPAAAAGTYNGKLKMRNFRVTDAPSLAALLDAVSIVGLLAQLNGPGIFFADASGEFYLTPDAVEVRRGSAIGPSMGVSTAGVYDFASDRMALQGTISPIYVLNGIGQIFSKRREGLFGFNYRLSGTSEAPQISVNPLSILTPGVFRDLFRAAPPKLPQ
ncbi:MAG TPA: AsmA-like C-terminal region-containing protein [Albidovulum sp.]|uniref:YhdP family protein n=1 Tax=Albidovulum sp. TaxID=1872424 RepID=UPI002BB08E20|nr:AsmA-like C-terminal region-containing protein [Albidovulum sp.]